ncbi:hypothetical protein AVEN_48802-1 [Araneus ventricosus]|uniref:Uncharacterized protein n=1 Tax=Araneus ventricosus TaxID=182803 RepID=A0A4Y2IGG3_ARAVE|nr:hypothetical protein AVEN_48802-1 [Araneus ventricosus]
MRHRTRIRRNHHHRTITRPNSFHQKNGSISSSKALLKVKTSVDTCHTSVLYASPKVSRIGRSRPDDLFLSRYDRLRKSREELRDRSPQHQTEKPTPGH